MVMVLVVDGLKEGPAGRSSLGAASAAKFLSDGAAS